MPGRKSKNGRKDNAEEIGMDQTMSWFANHLMGTSNYTLMLRFERRLNSVVAVIGVGMTRLELFLRPACRCGGI